MPKIFVWKAFANYRELTGKDVADRLSSPDLCFVVRQFQWQDKIMTSLAHQNDDRFREPGIAAPLTFLIMFVFFIYGALLVGLLGLSNWIIHAWNLTFFINLGKFGVFLLAILIPVLWAAIVGISWLRKWQRSLFLRCSTFSLCHGFYGQWCGVVHQNYGINALKNCARWSEMER